MCILYIFFTTDKLILPYRCNFFVFCLATGWVGGLIRVKDHCSIILLDVVYIVIFVAPYITWMRHELGSLLFPLKLIFGINTMFIAE